MKHLFFLVNILVIFSFSSCCNDDDHQPEAEPETLVGIWTLESVSGDSNLGCNTENPTILVFLDNSEVIIKSFDASFSSSNVDCNIDFSCKDKAIGDYTLNVDQGSMSFEKQGDDFIPPPKNTFSYRMEGNILLVETTNSCIDPPIQYSYKKD